MWDKYWNDLFGGNVTLPFKINIDLWKALNTLNSTNVGVSRLDWNKMSSIWRGFGAKMQE